TRVSARLKATNDALDLGFTRARADIYRVRQYVLGADAASRLVTSPTLADIAVRDESARAKSDQIQQFVSATYTTRPTRSADNPLPPAPIPPPPTGITPPPAAAAAAPTVGRILSTSTLLRARSFATSALTISQPVSASLARTADTSLLGS